MTFEYAIRYPEALIFDPSWRCVADVIASYHGGHYCTADGRVTGELVRAPLGSLAWEAVA